ncbi:hypothetical protein ACQY0O_004179 [Thecaphora frezii]
MSMPPASSSSSSYAPLSRKSVASRRSNIYSAQPSTPSALSKSASTPYHLYSSSPSRQSALASTPIRSSAAHHHNDPFATAYSPAFRRNAGFGSPGLRASLNTSRSSYDAGASTSRSSSPAPSPAATQGKARASKRFVRRKHWSEKLKSAPVDWFYHAQSQLMDVQQLLYNPVFGYPIGFALNVLSLLTHLVSPDSSFGAGLFGSTKGRTPAFGTAHRPSAAAAAHATARSQQLRKLAHGQAEAWLRWTSVGLSLALVAISAYNAYVLFTSRRSYRLWMRSEKDEIRSENARLVPTYVDDDEHTPSIKDRLVAAALQLLRDVPIVGWFVPAPSPPSTPSADQVKIHELNVWLAPEVPLRIFSVYSPAHALWWQFASLLGVTSAVTWLLGLALISLFALQTHYLARAYAALVKDRILLAAEVMHEYDEKFVLPRAMPMVRDASTMTSQAETVRPEDWM